MILFLGGVVCGATVNRIALGIASFSAILLFTYSARLKGSILWGNFVVSLVTGLAFIYGGIAVNRFHESLIPAGFSFLFHFGREIIKDMQDIEGDRANRIVTFAIRCGQRMSLGLITVIYSLLIFSTLLPYFYDIYGIGYFIVVLIGVDAVVVGCLISMWRNPESKNLGRISNILKADMLIGLLAIYLGR